MLMTLVFLGVLVVNLLSNRVAESQTIIMNRVVNNTKAIGLLNRVLLRDAQSQSSVKWFGVLSESRKK